MGMVIIFFKNPKILGATKYSAYIFFLVSFKYTIRLQLYDLRHEFERASLVMTLPKLAPLPSVKFCKVA